MVLAAIIAATLVNGLMAFVGALALFFSEKRLNQIIKLFVSFSAGTLFSGSIFHLYSESVDEMGTFASSAILTAGFLLFFVIERYLWWHHCHEGHCETHPVSYLVLIGDGLHNLLDGMVIAASFLADFKVGILTTFLVLLHEIPQELGDFGVLVHSGFPPKKALIMNFLSQLMAVIGGVITFYTVGIVDYSIYILALAAGGFLYISASDLIPEIHQHLGEGEELKHILLFVCGILIMVALKFLGE
jgi:zinc and cadmium transporter